MRSQKKRLLFALPVAAMLALGAAGCTNAQNEPTEPTGDGEQITIAFVPGSTSSQFYVAMKEGAEKAADELGVNLVYQGAADFSPAAQTPILNALAATSPDAVVVAPTDADSMFAPLKALADGGAYIVTVDTQLADDSIVSAAVTASNEQGGALAADEIAAAVGGEGTVAVLGLSPAATTINARVDGFTQRAAEEYPGLNVLPTEYMSGSDIGDAQTKTEALLLAHPDIVAIFAPNQPASEGAANALKAQGKQGIPIVGYDSSERQVQLLKDGTVIALILQQPALEGELAVKAAVALVKGESVEKMQLLDNVVATTENADDEAISKYFY
ncbi:ABC transporter substrate-binding protein [Ruicaihuangia caeni]|uniref:ABC transporter substrate-binding protein n=1 Tax=Ruicaihuangia caeni TaxID=3042517 RepID=A0AAW6T7M1_9MICO|nr:ABC transporter substrate-binding protein [Klugiella sp. YN-L-19]MDI2099219.1 ABC transporter substrate-binding protein [Klugiella sp. YN-L-19]